MNGLQLLPKYRKLIWLGMNGLQLLPKYRKSKEGIFSLLQYTDGNKQWLGEYTQVGCRVKSKAELPNYRQCFSGHSKGTAMSQLNMHSHPTF